jgi:hypothetical protein
MNRYRRLTILLLLACTPLTAPAQGTASSRWETLVSQPPCDWLPQATVAAIVGVEAKPHARTTAADVSCIWRTARGNPLLTASVVKWSSPAAMVLERDALLQQIAQYGGDRFTQLPAPGGLATVVMRKDRGRITIFPTGSTADRGISINAHLVLKESEAEKDARRARATRFSEVLVKQHGL